MAGLGRRTFAAGEVLTASNVMGYLQDQAVMNFAGTAARGSAVPTPSEGMVSYLADSNAVEVYDGSAWKSVYPAIVNAGQVLQVVSSSYATNVATTSTSYVTTGLAATITPSSASNKIVILCNTGNYCDSRSGFAVYTIFRGTVAGTNLGTGNDGMVQIYPTTSASMLTSVAVNYLDSPSTTSATTYTFAMRSTAGTSINSQYGNAKASIILLEVKG